MCYVTGVDSGDAPVVCMGCNTMRSDGKQKVISGTMMYATNRLLLAQRRRQWDIISPVLVNE